MITLDNGFITFSDSSTMKSSPFSTTKSYKAPARVSGTVYTNTLTYPISVFVWVGTVSLVVSIGGWTMNAYTPGTRTHVKFIVPPNQTYSITSATILNWYEFY